PFANGSNSDALLALNPQTREWTTFRVPYPLGFYSRGRDGRIDDPNGGWKGRALYANYGTHFLWHIEGGKGTKAKIVKMQIRPNPLARGYRRAAARRHVRRVWRSPSGLRRTSAVSAGRVVRSDEVRPVVRGLRVATADEIEQLHFAEFDWMAFALQRDVAFAQELSVLLDRRIEVGDVEAANLWFFVGENRLSVDHVPHAHVP